MPSTCDDPRVDDWALETLDELLDLAADSKEKQPDNLLVEVLHHVTLSRKNTAPPTEKMSTNKYFDLDHFPKWTRHPKLEFQHMTVEMLSWQNNHFRLKIPPLEELKDAGYLYAWVFRTAICNSPKLLEHYMKEISETHQMDLNVNTNKYYQSLTDMQGEAKDLGCDLIVNCTGMGAREICKDKELIPARGTTLKFDRKSCQRRDSVQTNESGMQNLHDAIIRTSEEPWGSATHPAYLIPRGDTIVVGGTVLKGDEELTVRPEERERMMKSAACFGIDVESSPPTGEWVGLRPYRSLIECKFEERTSNLDESIPIFHNYGHGGSGWTIQTGAARACVNAVLGKSG